jgi:hypothetical protein
MAVIGVQIEDDGGSIKITSSGVVKNIFKDTIVRVEPFAGTKLRIIDAIGTNEYLYTDVTLPVTASLAALVAAIETMMETGGGALPTGAATEATLQDIKSNTNNLDTTLSSRLSENTGLDIKNALFEVRDAVDRTANAALTNVASTIASVLLLAANNSRRSATIVNDSTQILFVKYGTTASATSYTHKLESGDELIIDDYSGVIHGIWDVANGNARVTETTV